MNDFFRQRRRKVGLVTLVMACTLMAGWLRSMTVCDIVSFASGSGTTASLALWDGFLIWGENNNASNPPPDFPEWETESSQFMREVFIEEGLKIHWRWYGLGTCQHQNPDGSIDKISLVPDWEFVAPLTVVSAFLLLSKPRNSNREKISASNLVERA